MIQPRFQVCLIGETQFSSRPCFWSKYYTLLPHVNTSLGKKSATAINFPSYTTTTFAAIKQLLSILVVEWICWLNGQRKSAPTPEVKLDLSCHNFIRIIHWSSLASIVFLLSLYGLPCFAVALLSFYYLVLQKHFI